MSFLKTSHVFNLSSCCFLGAEGLGGGKVMVVVGLPGCRHPMRLVLQRHFGVS